MLIQININYPNVEKELANKPMKIPVLAENNLRLITGLVGLTDLTVNEAQRIQKLIQSELPLEELFKTEV